MKVVVLFSGGIDSPVAAYLLAREHEVILLHMDNRPYTDDREMKKVKELCGRVGEASGKEVKLFAAPHGEVAQKEFMNACTRRYQCVLCKRMMLRTASLFAEKMEADALATGDSLGQVASQTLQNLAVEEEATGLPILRPLIGMDKTEIIEMAKMIGTYELSIRPSAPCGAVPNKPSVRARIADIEEEEGKLDVPEAAKKISNSVEEIL